MGAVMAEAVLHLLLAFSELPPRWAGCQGFWENGPLETCFHPGSRATLLESVLTHWVDTFPDMVPQKPALAMAHCAVGFIAGLPLVSRQAGLQLLHLLNAQVLGPLLAYTAFCEVVAVSWVYEHCKSLPGAVICDGAAPTLSIGRRTRGGSATSLACAVLSLPLHSKVSLNAVLISTLLLITGNPI
ncbi:uncharacterized protein LOC119391733 [Rhipicephalus sanguineus]|uniref:uncharacterized protein LOC119391733 n=1 Tax=Rhipicephalus sanguineus TaxID=34632 RepID=UPI0020C2EEFD|nr:uncharacterized protein LOC119391733 [Rhipicephalus sanguineus]